MEVTKGWSTTDAFVVDWNANASVDAGDRRRDMPTRRRRSVILLVVALRRMWHASSTFSLERTTDRPDTPCEDRGKGQTEWVPQRW